MNWSNDPEDDPVERDVFAAHVIGVPASNGVNPIAQMLSDVIATTIGDLNQRRTESEKAPLPGLITDGLPALANAALGAVEGTLKSKSLDGALKQAQILAAYAEARERNANAEKLEAESELTRIAAARARLAFAIEAFRALGVDPAVALTAGGVPAVVLGEGLSGQLDEAATEAPQITEGGSKD